MYTNVTFTEALNNRVAIRQFQYFSNMRNAKGDYLNSLFLSHVSLMLGKCLKYEKLIFVITVNLF